MHSLLPANNLVLAIASSQKDVFAGLAIGGILLMVVLAFVLAFHIFFSFCYKCICEKCGKNAGVLIWFPLLQMIPLFQAVGMSGWMTLLMLIPVVNLFVFIFLLWKLCEARSKPGWLALLVVVPFGLFFIIPFLAFSK